MSKLAKTINTSDSELLVMAVYLFRGQAWKLFSDNQIPIVVEDVERKRRLFAAVIESSAKRPIVFVSRESEGFTLCSQITKSKKFLSDYPDARDIPDTLRIAFEDADKLEAVDITRLRAHNINPKDFPGLPLPAFRQCMRGCSPWPTNTEDHQDLLVTLKALISLYSVAKDFCNSPRVKAREDALVARILSSLGRDDNPSEPCLLIEAQRENIFKKTDTAKRRSKKNTEVTTVQPNAEIPAAENPVLANTITQAITWGFAPSLLPAQNLEVDPEFLEATPEEIVLLQESELAQDKQWEALSFLSQAAVSEGGKPYFPRLAVLCDAKTGAVFPSTPAHPSTSPSRAIWQGLISAVQMTQRRPKTLALSREQEFTVLAPVLASIGIEAKLVKKLKAAPAAALVLADRLMSDMGLPADIVKDEILH